MLVRARLRPLAQAVLRAGRMVTFSLLLGISLLAIDAAPVSASKPARAKRVILFIIDGLAEQAVERLPMPHACREHAR